MLTICIRLAAYVDEYTWERSMGNSLEPEIEILESDSMKQLDNEMMLKVTWKSH